MGGLAVKRLDVGRAQINLGPHGELVLRCAYEDRYRAKAVFGYYWDAAVKAWLYPCTPETYSALRAAFPTAWIEPEVERVVQQLVGARRAVDALKYADDVEIALPVRLSLWAHQRRMAAMALALPAFAFLAEMGTGKTAAAVAVAGRRYLDGQITSCLIVAPKSVLPVWEREFANFAAFPYSVRVLDCSIAKRERALQAAWPEGLRVAVTNYESVWRMERALGEFVQGGLVVADEGHRIKTPGARQSKAMGRLGRLASYRLLLTGTPVTQSPLDIWSQYRFLEPSVFGPSFYAFRSRYAVMGGYGNYQIVRYRNLDELIRKAHSIAFRITRAECLDLPPEISQVVPLRLGSESRRVYDSLLSEAMADLGLRETVSATNVLAQLLRLQQVTGGHVGTESGVVARIGTEKRDVCVDLLEDLLDECRRKVVVFCRFLPELRDLLDELERVGIPAAGLYGETADRAELVRRFQEEPEPRVLVAQIQTGGLGISLHRADTAVFYSTGWSLADYQQAKARIQRAGQAANRVQYFHLVAERTVDERVYEALAAKRDLARVVVDDWRVVFAPGEGIPGAEAGCTALP